MGLPHCNCLTGSLQNWSGERDSNSRVRFGRPPYWPLYDHRLLALGGGFEPNPFEASKASGLPFSRSENKFSAGSRRGILTPICTVRACSPHS